MKIKTSATARTVFSEKELMADDSKKIAFIGRSNVGKSSLINKLLNRKNLARTSSKPGKTVSVNYYFINESFYFVDLPGYGYAKISKKESQRVKALISSFFSTVRNLKLIVILIDSRRGFTDPDIEILSQLLDKKFKMLTVLTKSDKIGTSGLLNQKTNLQNKFGLKVISFSIKLNINREEILDNINEALME
ncbi:MAG: YihA family ribosome biogenesis GTP-binding protein [Candidatus Aminicenantes bacterium]|nr:YihA family ribosome biogenesis GTP-binding protein [Candidatus Aminicenantes bacterium]